MCLHVQGNSSCLFITLNHKLNGRGADNWKLYRAANIVTTRHFPGIRDEPAETFAVVRDLNGNRDFSSQPEKAIVVALRGRKKFSREFIFILFFFFVAFRLFHPFSFTRPRH